MGLEKLQAHNTDETTKPSFRRRPESISFDFIVRQPHWVPACAGMTDIEINGARVEKPRL